MMWRNLAVLACLLVLLGALTVPVMSTETYNLNCYLASDDQDNDGYADGSSSHTVQLPREERLTCPEGYVPGKNDDPDTDPSCHPRKLEKQFNSKDDNCNGLTDEPQIRYDPYTNEITTSSFNIRLKINDQDTVDNRNDLYANIEYAKLSDPWTRYHTGKKKVTLTVSDTGRYYCTLTLDGLSETTVYMARVQFYVKKQFTKATPAVAVLVDPLTNREVVQIEPVVMIREPELESRGRVIFPYPDRDPETTSTPAPTPRTTRRTPPKRGSTATATAAAPAPRTTTTQPTVRRTAADQPEVAPWRGGLTSPWRRITRLGTRTYYEAVGDPTDWYFDTTDGTKEKSKVRTKMVHKAILQFYDSEEGKIGILGYQRVNGALRWSTRRYCSSTTPKRAKSASWDTSASTVLGTAATTTTGGALRSTPTAPGTGWTASPRATRSLRWSTTSPAPTTPSPGSRTRTAATT